MSEVKTGMECGITLENYGDVKQRRHHRGVRRPSAWRPKYSPDAEMATIGVLTLELRLENSHSLKEKRHVVKSLKERLRNKFNVAVAEIDYQDLWQRAAVAAVTVSSDHGHAEKVLRSVEEEAAALLGPELADATLEWLE